MFDFVQPVFCAGIHCALVDYGKEHLYGFVAKWTGVGEYHINGVLLNLSFYHTLSRTLRLIIGAWEGDPNSLSANMLNAVAKLVVVYGDALNDEVFKDKVGAVSLKQLIRVAKDRRNGSSGYAEAMLLEYNGKKKGSN